MNECFKKRERLRLKKDFDCIFQKGNRVLSSDLVILYVKNDLDNSRIAFSIRKKFGKAHKRNHLRRYIKEIYRKNKSLFPNGYDYLFIPRKPLSTKFDNINYQEMNDMILDLVRKINEKNCPADD